MFVVTGQILTAQGLARCRNWNEIAADQSGPIRLTRATADHTYLGDLQCESKVEFLLFYADPKNGNFTGLEWVRGQLGGRAGGFALQHVGRFHEGISDTELAILPGSGVGDLIGIKGSGRAIWSGEHGQPSRYLLDYTFS